MEILKEVLNDIKPSKEEEKEVFDKINFFLNKVNKGLKGAKAVLGGSGAKGTWLSNAHDADIFVQFDYNKYKGKSDVISDILEKNLKKKFKKVNRLHGSRDYFQIKDKGSIFEIVPVLKISKAKDAENITDVSLLHAAWVNKYKKYADDMRLAKQFCKANGVYGAESYIKGFSGYVCEILTVYYKGFMKLVRAAAKWEGKTIIDAEKYYKNKNDVLFNLNKSKLISPLVIVEPVQADRNTAAAMSDEKYNQFIDACKKFLKNPSKKFFLEEEITQEKIEKKVKKNKLILLEAKALSGKKDVVGSKLLKIFEFLSGKLEDFKIYDSGWEWNKNTLFWFIVDKKPLDKFVIKQGPPVKLKDHVKRFKKQYKGKTFVKKGKIYAKDKREFVDAEKLVKKLIKDEYVKEKIKDIKIS